MPQLSALKWNQLAVVSPRNIPATFDFRLAFWALREMVTALLGPQRPWKQFASHLKPLSIINCLQLKARGYNTKIQDFIYQLFEDRYITANNKTALILDSLFGYLPVCTNPEVLFSGQPFWELILTWARVTSHLSLLNRLSGEYKTSRFGNCFYLGNMLPFTTSPLCQCQWIWASFWTLSLSGADTAGITVFWLQMFSYGASTQHPTRVHYFWIYKRYRATLQCSWAAGLSPFPTVFSCWLCSTVRLRPDSQADKSYNLWPAHVVSASLTINPATAQAGTGLCPTKTEWTKLHRAQLPCSKAQDNNLHLNTSTLTL